MSINKAKFTTATVFSQAVGAKTSLQLASKAAIRKALLQMATLLQRQQQSLLAANSQDLEKQAANNPKNDRLLLTPERIDAIAAAIRKVAELPDPTGEVLLRKKLPNKLLLRKITVPLGVVGAIYESRPNVTFDIAALCLRSRNVALLKGSTDAWHTNQEAIRLIKLALVAANINPDAVTLLPPDREVVDEMLKATQHIDVIIPRGSDGLIQYVRKNSLVPVIETGAGVCHVYVHTKADLQKAVDIVLNAKTSRPSVCNAMDTVIVDRAIAKKFLRKLGLAFAKAEVKLLADPEAFDLLAGYPQLNKARPEDFSREFLSLTAAVKIVDDFEAALQHIQQYSTRHSEAIVTENKTIATQFLQLVDAAAVYVNASTRFTDGAVFGLGAEIGISTQKLHARGPFALEKLVTEKWLVTGNGQTR